MNFLNPLALIGMAAAGIPLLLAIAGIATGFATLHMLSWISPISVWSMNFSMMIGLAVGIDYSLFIVSRYREERVEGKDAIKAIENALSTSGKAVFLSALTVVLSLSAVFLVPVMVFQTMALGMIISVLAVALAALTLLPAVLVAMGDQHAVDPHCPGCLGIVRRVAHVEDVRGGQAQVVEYRRPQAGDGPAGLVQSGIGQCLAFGTDAKS